MGRISQLSLAAIRMAASVLPTEPAIVAQQLYRFGTVPRGPTLDRDFGLDDEPMAVLGMTVGGSSRRRVEPVYEATCHPGWYFFRTLSRVQMAAVCKLYVSPRPEALVDAFPIIVDAFVRCQVPSFKVGRGIEGLLRSDKIVAYFEDRTHLDDVAGVLERSLQGCPVQGVPFSADAGGNGLLSSGIDPPGGHPAMSWRSWVTKRLATSLTALHSTSCSDLVAAALADIRLAGVDPDRWIPTSDAFL